MEIKNDLFEKAKQAVAEKHGFENWEALEGMLFAWQMPEIWQKVFEYGCNEAVKADRILVAEKEHRKGSVGYELLLLSLNELPLPFPQQPDGI